jgi:hypothetical protein
MSAQRNLFITATLLLGTACADAVTTPTSPGPPQFAGTTCTLEFTAEDVLGLIAEIDGLVADGVLTHGQAEALSHHLINSLRSLDRGNVCAAVAQLEAFGMLVRNLVNAGALTPAQAAPLLAGGAVGNTAPTVIIDAPPEGGLFAFGESIPFSVVVTDLEDGVVDCDLVVVTFVLGHDDHGHPEDTVNGCDGVLSTNAADVSHGGNIFGTVTASYTDFGSAGGAPLTTSASVDIRQKRQEVEFVLAESGTTVAPTNDPAGGGQHRASLGDGDWIALNGPFDLVNIESLGFRVASTSTDVPAGTAMAEVEIRLDAADGPILATSTLTSTGAATVWESQTVQVNDPGGPHAIYLVFRSVSGGQTGGDLFNLNRVEFGGTGIAGP